MFKNDLIGLASEPAPIGARPLLQPVIHAGKLIEPLSPIAAARQTVMDGLAKLPSRFKDINKAPQNGKTKYTKDMTKVIEKKG